MRFRAVGLTDVGRVRDHNEDSFLAPSVDDLRLVAVADGVGGHEGGEVASALALEVLESWQDRLADRGGEALRDAVQDANRTVWSKGRSDPELHRMGTTLTAAWLDGSHVWIAHVGDSRAYLMRGGRLEQVTNDQTLVQQLVDQGTIDADEAARHPQRNLVLQAVGSEPDVNVELSHFDLHPGDRLLLTSDGLHDVISHARMSEILSTEADPDAATRLLIEEANAGGGHDNITAVLLDAEAEDGETAADPSPLVVSKPAMEKRSEPSGGRRGRVGVAVFALVLVVGLALFGVGKLASRPRYFVTQDSDRVVIVLGTPGRDGEPPEGEVVRRTDFDVSTLPVTYQRQLETGIEADTLQEAEQIVESLSRNRVLGPQDTPTPSPPSVSPEPAEPVEPSPVP